MNFFVKYERISLSFLNINRSKYKIWNILRITGVWNYGTLVSPGYERVKTRAEKNRNSYVEQGNLCVKLFQKNKTESFWGLNETDLRDNKKFLGLFEPFLSNKVFPWWEHHSRGGWKYYRKR